VNPSPTPESSLIKPGNETAGPDAAVTDTANDTFHREDLAEIVNAFNDVTERMQKSHETLTAEVSRLKSELHSANEQLRRSEQLAALGEMAAGIAHEIRNPLASIQLYAGMLIEDLQEMPGQQEIARKISRAVRGMEAIVRDVLAFARDIELHREKVEVGRLIADTLSDCHVIINETQVRVVSPDGSRAKRTLLCDPSLMRLVLGNIVRNAAEAMQENTPARERVLEIEILNNINETGTHDEITLRFRDSGPGITDEVRRRMFNPFFTTRAAGTGLGLAIVHRIVDAHRGRITIKNRTGDVAGTEVCIILPADTETTETTDEKQMNREISL